MKNMMTASVCALLLGAATIHSAQAACTIDLSAAEKAIGDKRDVYGPSAPDLRRLRDAAQTLSRYGKDEACETVMKAINDLAAAPPSYHGDDMATAMPPPASPTPPATGTAPPANPPATVGTAPPAPTGTPPATTGTQRQATAPFQYDRTAAARNTTPLMDGKGMVSVDRLIGATLYSATDGRTVGEIEDIVFGANPNDGFAIVGYGGFLGMGEKKVRVELKDLMVNRSYNTYYVKMAEGDFKSAPGLKKVNGQWVSAGR